MSFGVLEIAKNVVSLLALLWAAGFAVFKLNAGYEVVNLKLTLGVERSPKPNSQFDLLSVSAVLEKGDRGSILLHDAQARITTADGAQTLQFVGIERLSRRKDPLSGRIFRRVALWDTRAEKAPFLALTPGERTEFACVCEIRHHDIAQIETIFLGRRVNSWRFGQWRASHISLPKA